MERGRSGCHRTELAGTCGMRIGELRLLLWDRIRHEPVHVMLLRFTARADRSWRTCLRTGRPSPRRPRGTAGVTTATWSCRHVVDATGCYRRGSSSRRTARGRLAWLSTTWPGGGCRRRPARAAGNVTSATHLHGHSARATLAMAQPQPSAVEYDVSPSECGHEALLAGSTIIWDADPDATTKTGCRGRGIGA
jgi:hypothetical protein